MQTFALIISAFSCKYLQFFYKYLQYNTCRVFTHVTFYEVHTQVKQETKVKVLGFVGIYDGRRLLSADGHVDRMLFLFVFVYMSWNDFVVVGS